MEEQAAHLRAWLNELGAALRMPELNPRSQKQLHEALCQRLRLPERWIFDKGVRKRPMNREALEWYAASYMYAQPICYATLAARDTYADIKTLSTEIRNGRWYTSWNITAAETGRLSSSKAWDGSGSNLQNVTRDSSAEDALHLRRMFVADPNRILVSMDRKQSEAREVGYLLGTLFDDWKYLDLLESTDIHTWVAREAFTALPWTGDMKRDRKVAETPYYRNSTYRDMAKRLAHGCVTEEHEVLTPTGWVSVAEHPDTIMVYDPCRKVSYWSTPSYWVDKTWSGDLIELEGRGISLRVTADHRVYLTKDGSRGKLQVCPAGELPKTGGIPLGGGYVGGTEKIDPSHARMLAAFQCDGSRQSARTIRFHMHKERKFARLEKLAEECGYAYRRTSSDSAAVTSKGIGAWPKKADSYILAWGRESITAYVEEHKHWDGHSANNRTTTVSSVDKEHLEWLQTAGRLVGIGGAFGYIHTSGYGSTVHTLHQNARQYASIRNLSVRSRRAVSQVRVYCPTVETGAFYVRRHRKISITGNSSYCGTAATMARHAQTTTKFVQAFQDKFFELFPAMLKWHLWTAQRIQLDGYLDNLFGDRRHFFDDPLSDETLRKAVAHIPQSSTARRTNMGVLALWRSDLPIELLAQGHDSITFQCRPSDLAAVIPRALDLTSIELVAPSGRAFTVPGDCKVGYNWGNWSATANPNGLREWSGSDDRTRQPGTSILDIRL
jgi:hypothetical protein